MRITTARDQAAMYTPWHTADVSVRPDAIAPGSGGMGNQPMPPQKPSNVGHGDPWTQVDWRTADDYGAHSSTSRPPMSSDIPHPTELLNPKNKNHAALLERASQSQDPKHDPWGVLNGTPWSFEDLVQNHMSHHQNMSPEQDFQGRVWYRAAHDSTKDVAQKTLGDHERTVALDSALSPVKDWDLNNEQMIHYMTNYQGQEGYRTKPQTPDAPENDPNNRFRVKAPDTQNEKAHRLLDAPAGSLSREDYLNILSGPKTSSFMNNIMEDKPLREPRPGHDDDEGFYDHPINPHTGEPDWRYGDQDVTADTHHARVQTIGHGSDLSQVGYETPPHFNEKLTVNKKAYHPGYDVHARASAEATRRLNLQQDDPYRHLVPKQAQAGPWVKFKSDVVGAGVSPNMPEPGTAPKSFNPDKPGVRNGPYAGEQDQPRYQRDQSSDFFIHPSQTPTDLRQSPNWNNRNPTWRNEKNRTSSIRVGFLDEWISQNFPHRAAPPAEGPGPDPHLARVASAHLSAFDDFDAIMEGQSFPHQQGGGAGYNSPFRGEDAEDLWRGCPHCHAGPQEMHDPHCPVNHTDDPWRDTKALGGPPLRVTDDTMHRLNSVRALLASVDDLMGG